MLGRPRRHLSQSSYQLIQAIHAEADRLRQIDRGLGYGYVTPARRLSSPITQGRIGVGARDIPLHIGPQIEAVRDGDGWAA